MSDKKSSSGGSVFVSLLAVAFIVLKLCHVIDWPWWLVLCPCWAGIALLLLACVLYLIGAGIKQVVKENTQKKDADSPPIESKWQTRLREMQEVQRKAKNNSRADC